MNASSYGVYVGSIPLWVDVIVFMILLVALWKLGQVIWAALS